METVVKSAAKEVIICRAKPVVLIGDRINPTGRKKLSAQLLAGNVEMVRQEALRQVESGADILDVNVGATGVDEVTMLPKALEAVTSTVDVPISLDSHNVKALELALRQYKGKAIINSVSGQEKSLDEILPLVKEFGTAVVGLLMDDQGIPPTVEQRIAIARKILERAEKAGIPKSDVILDALVTTISTDSKAALITLETIRRIDVELDVNQTIGASNISFGMPDREVINLAFLTLAISNGVTCPCVNVAKVRQYALAADLLLAKDRYAMRYIKHFRQYSGKRAHPDTESLPELTG
jgi:5-methyltetrahydrofolate--homocysteine methyltransferase